MTNPMILRVVLMICIILGGLFAIIATVGKEWQKLEDIDGSIITAGFWEYCYDNDSETICSPVDEMLKLMMIYTLNYTEILSGIKGN